MNTIDFLVRNWGVILDHPLFFILTASIFCGLGFFAGKLIYAAVASTARERLEACRDDLARLEKGKREESETVTRLAQELAEFKDKFDSLHNDKSRPLQAKPRSPESYFLTRPYYSLSEALEQAKNDKKLVFAVIYDEAHPRKSKLEYSLGYFMEYLTTKQLVDEYFVPALLKVSSDGVSRLVPEDNPLENCLLVILNAEGKTLSREAVYANPDEALKQVREIVSRAGMA